MAPALKTYMLVFFLCGFIFSSLSTLMDIWEGKGFNLLHFLVNIVLSGILGIIVYYISIVLPRKGKPAR